MLGLGPKQKSQSQMNIPMPALVVGYYLNLEHLSIRSEIYCCFFMGPNTRNLTSQIKKMKRIGGAKKKAANRHEETCQAGAKTPQERTSSLTGNKRLDGKTEFWDPVEKLVKCKLCVFPLSHHSGHAKWCTRNKKNKVLGKDKVDTTQSLMMNHFSRQKAKTGGAAPAPTQHQEKPTSAAALPDTSNAVRQGSVPPISFAPSQKQLDFKNNKKESGTAGGMLSAEVMAAKMVQYLPTVSKKTADMSKAFARPHDAISAIAFYLWIEYFPKKFHKKGSGGPYGEEDLARMARLKRDFPYCQAIVCIKVPHLSLDKLDKLLEVQPDNRMASDHSELSANFRDYAVAEGTSLYFLQYEFEGIRLQCPKSNCCGSLVHQKMPLVKENCAGVPIHNIGSDSPVDWAFVMRYQCNTCKETYNGDNGALLMSLPVRIRNRYPVEPRYIFPGQLHRYSLSMSELISDSLVTSSSGEEISKKMYQRCARHYERVVEEYYTRCLVIKKQFSKRGKEYNPTQFPPFEDYFCVTHPDGKLTTDNSWIVHAATNLVFCWL